MARLGHRMRLWRRRSQRCSCCGAEIGGIPTDFSTAAPWRFGGVTDEDFARRVKLTSDTCVVDGEVFFVRGNIVLPIRGTDQRFAWGVWCSLSRESFERVMARWDAADRDTDPPRFGWLYADLPGYSDSTWHLKTMVH